jgi:hypothetical protein
MITNDSSVRENSWSLAAKKIVRVGSYVLKLRQPIPHPARLGSDRLNVPATGARIPHLRHPQTSRLCLTL